MPSCEVDTLGRRTQPCRSGDDAIQYQQDQVRLASSSPDTQGQTHDPETAANLGRSCAGMGHGGLRGRARSPTTGLLGSPVNGTVGQPRAKDGGPADDRSRKSALTAALSTQVLGQLGRAGARFSHDPSVQARVSPESEGYAAGSQSSTPGPPCRAAPPLASCSGLFGAQTLQGPSGDTQDRVSSPMLLWHSLPCLL
ncbi:hypothetical protein TREES_T100008308 [Tupaia chinensis]|uniref:Uncharacterized protein n=1 Tax=Tupaia chinensis TaxID=246437 RepID=L9LBG1_TUPCH|nr:hypothetical protein TREES_T100008308 [Tupaia chinensis]